jgi:mercuric ion transport protein
MRDLLKQLGSTAGAAFAAACCAGAGWALAALSAVGAGFLVRDAVLIPLFVVLLAVSLWFLWRSASAHDNLNPFYLGSVGALAALAGLWTSAVVLFAGLLAIVASSIWDFVGARRQLTTIHEEKHEHHR